MVDCAARVVSGPARGRVNPAVRGSARGNQPAPVQSEPGAIDFLVGANRASEVRAVGVMVYGRQQMEFYVYEKAPVAGRRRISHRQDRLSHGSEADD